MCCNLRVVSEAATSVLDNLSPKRRLQQSKGNAFVSHKYAGKQALSYALGINIHTGNLVWIQSYHFTLRGSIMTSNSSTVFYASASSRASGWREVPDKFGMGTTLSAPTTPATRLRIWQCRGGYLTLNKRLKNKREYLCRYIDTIQLLWCMVQYFMSVGSSRSSLLRMESPWSKWSTETNYIPQYRQFKQPKMTEIILIVTYYN